MVLKEWVRQSTSKGESGITAPEISYKLWIKQGGREGRSR